MHFGTVLFFYESKGYGFIKPDEAIASNSGCSQAEQTSIFVHASGLLDKIQANDKVRFNVVQGKNGLSAVHVEKIDSVPVTSSITTLSYIMVKPFKPSIKQVSITAKRINKKD